MKKKKKSSKVSFIPKLDLSYHLEWSFGVVDAPFVNAFALLGGIIRVSNMLLEQLRLMDGELVALLGHEMGHVLHRHSQACVIRQKLLSTLLGALVYEDHDEHRETFGEAVGEFLLQSATFLGEMKFSRANEYVAPKFTLTFSHFH